MLEGKCSVIARQEVVKEPDAFYKPNSIEGQTQICDAVLSRHTDMMGGIRQLGKYKLIGCNRYAALHSYLPEDAQHQLEAARIRVGVRVISKC
jgi:hypothetical protein